MNFLSIFLAFSQFLYLCDNVEVYERSLVISSMKPVLLREMPKVEYLRIQDLSLLFLL